MNHKHKMAETTKRPTNWADMDHENEDDEQEIGVTRQHKKDATEDPTRAEGEGAEEGKQGGDKPYTKKYRKDYDPNYKKRGAGPWRKDQQEEFKKPINPPAPRQKTERGDYVVTSFQIPDRVALIKADATKKTGEEGEEVVQTKKRRVGAFQIDDSDLEEGEQQEETSP